MLSSIVTQQRFVSVAALRTRVHYVYWVMIFRVCRWWVIFLWGRGCIFCLRCCSNTYQTKYDKPKNNGWKRNKIRSSRALLLCWLLHNAGCSFIYADPFCFFAASNFFITVARFLINVSCSINLFICFVYSGNYHQGLRNIFNGAIREFRFRFVIHNILSFHQDDFIS